LPAWPVYIVRDDPASLSFRVAVDDHAAATIGGTETIDSGEEGRRRYVTGKTLVRLHKSSFRVRVLRAYHEACAICRLHHPELLEAAHILSDKDPRAEPIVSNGISLCKLHHAAYDANVLGIRHTSSMTSTWPSSPTTRC
jgi:putative restriction endonuclease